MRFAPSPTGQLHVGNARTALFNWLFARQKGGVMVLRIEDTDIERSETRYEDQLLADLKWLGIDWDEGPDLPGKGGPFAPYRQSDRLDLHRRHAERLLDEGKAYLCFCTEEDLQAERERAMSERRSPIYSGRCRRIEPAEARRRRAGGEQAAIRLHIPEHPIRFHDMVRGEVEFPNEVISDPIILRSSGMPVYNYVVVIDDALMEITHVIRGDDHLSNTPKQVALYEALGWPAPEFAHLSTILGADRTRLSKRHGATSIANFREMGVLPHALFNYLALLGWAPTGGTREIFNRDELIKEFDLGRVTPSPAVFDMEKLYWLNRQYVAIAWKEFTTATGTPLAESVPKLPTSLQLGALTWGYFERAGFMVQCGTADAVVVRWLSHVVGLLIPSVDRLDQLPQRASLIFDYDAKRALEAIDNAEVLGWPLSRDIILRFWAKVRNDESAKAAQLTPERFKQIVNEVKAETGAKGKELFHPIRLVVTGSHSGPEFDKLIPILEEGSRLPLPKHVLSVFERVEAFAKVYKT